MNTIQHKHNKIAFMDMDGFIAKYDRKAYMKEYGINPNKAQFEDEAIHYFLTCERDNNAYVLVKNILEEYDESYFLTTVPPEMSWHIPDKITWLHDCVPEIDTDTQLLIAESDKAETIMVLQQLKTLTKDMILIDDYNPNLFAWEAAGGTAIKYLNGINTKESWDGIYITREEALIPGILNIKLKEYYEKGA
jgi:histidinol phosphatase-like enzyme